MNLSETEDEKMVGFASEETFWSNQSFFFFQCGPRLKHIDKSCIICRAEVAIKIMKLNTVNNFGSDGLKIDL